jgi:hypothetical protein
MECESATTAADVPCSDPRLHGGSCRINDGIRVKSKKFEKTITGINVIVKDFYFSLLFTSHVGNYEKSSVDQP